MPKLSHLAPAVTGCMVATHWPLKGCMLYLILATLGVGIPQKLVAEEKYYAATNLWQVRLETGSRSSPALGSEGVVLLGTFDGYLISLNPDGTVRWRFRTGFEIASSPSIGNDGTVYVGCRDHRLYAVDQDGRKRWAFKSGGWVDASPALGTNGTVYFGSWDKKFYALNPDGTLRWDFITGGPVVSSAAIDRAGVIYFGSHDRKFYALHPDGTKKWEYATEGAITSSAAVGADGELYFASVDGVFHAVNPDGTRRWELRTGGFTASSPVLGTDGTIFVSVNQTHCAIAADGKFKWQRPFWNPQPGYFGENAAAVLANGHVVFTGGDAFVMTVPADNGLREWVWNYFLYGASYSSPLVADNGTIYVMSSWPGFSALQRHIPLAQTPWPMFQGNPQHTGRVSAQ